MRKPRPTSLFVAAATLLVAVTLLSSANLPGQVDVARLRALRAKKLEAPFLRRVSWVTDFAAAKAAAAKAGKPILIYFTRSDEAIRQCELVERDLLSTDGFAKLAAGTVPFCHITTGLPDQADAGLLAQMGARQQPVLVFTDEAGRRLARVERLSSIADIRTVFERDVQSYFRLRGLAAKGDKNAKASYFIMRLQLGHLAPAAVQKELRNADYLTADQQRKIRKVLASLEMMDVLAGTKDGDPKSAARATERILAMMKAGRIPGGRMAHPFWQVLLAHADSTEDVELFATALRSLKALPEGLDPKWVRRMDLRLKAMRVMKQRKKDGG